MTIEEKCIERLKSLSIKAFVDKLDEDAVYIYVGHIMLQIDKTEVEFQADEYDNQED